ncbi:MAG: nucleotidyltransferase family protein [Nitrospirae bacterium]|nr:nucleotidyltransferase family protein [Nitrospirota bacterium]MCL5978720.1 nucleotidyltransferase family protein [Nitrospirota bacterium]
MKTLQQKEIIKLLKKEMPFLAMAYGVKKIAVFGSYAKGEQKKKSDIDILVDLKKPLGLGFVELADKLEQLLGIKTDVVTFDCFKGGFRNPRYKHIAEDIKKNLILI